jgi:hypothetical protein
MQKVSLLSGMSFNRIRRGMNAGCPAPHAQIPTGVTKELDSYETFELIRPICNYRILADFFGESASGFLVDAAVL